MQLRIFDFLLFTWTVAVALAVRSIASFAQDYGVTLIMAVATSSLVAFSLPFLGSSIRQSIFWGMLQSTAIVLMHIFECLLRTQTTKYIWAYASGGDEILVYFVVALIILFVSAIASTLAALLATYIGSANKGFSDGLKERQ